MRWLLRLRALPECLELLAWIRLPICGFESCQAGEIPKENSGEHRDCRAEDQHWAIHMDGGFVRKRKDRQSRDNPAHTFISCQNAKGCSGYREHHGLGEQLADQAFASGADRCADREFMLTGGSASQEQNRHVRATDDQQRDHSAKQQHQRPGKFPQYLFIQRDDGGFTVLRIAFVVFCELIGDTWNSDAAAGKFTPGFSLTKAIQ